MLESTGGGVRRVSIAGRRYTLTGDPGDSYFQYVSMHAKDVWNLHSVAAAVLPPDGVAMDVGPISA